MDDLEKYIKDNAAAFDDAELPEGHLERFEKLLDAQGAEESDVPETRTVILSWIPKVLFAVAASLAVVFVLNHQKQNKHDWFAGVGYDQVEICDTYYSRVAELYEDIFTANPDGSLDEQVASIAEESIPLIDQLPDELGEAERAAILKEYYSELLDGLVKVKNIK